MNPLKKLLIASTFVAIGAVAATVAFASHAPDSIEAKDRFYVSIQAERCGAGHPAMATQTYDIALKMLAWAEHKIETEDLVLAVLATYPEAQQSSAEPTIRQYFIACEVNGEQS